MKNILIAEDEDVLQRVLKDRFKEEGWHVTTVDDGAEAIKKLENAKAGDYDLMLLDLLMPEKDGFEVLEALKKMPELSDLAVIVLSNLGGDEDIKRAMSLGADDYYVKSQHPVSEVIEKAEKFASSGHVPTKKEKQDEEEEEEKSVAEEAK